MAIGVGMGMLLAGLASGGAAVYGANRASRANDRAAEISDAANQEALAFERDREARRQAEWDRTMDEEERRWYAEQERLAPYRAASTGALSQLVSLAGLPAYTPAPAEAPNFDRPMPADWQPGDPTSSEALTERRTAVRRPRAQSSSLTDLLRDPATLDTVSRVAAEQLERTPATPTRERVTAPATGVSDVAYERIVDRPAAVHTLVRGRGATRRRPSHATA